jgi:serine/threonine-protein kinase
MESNPEFVSRFQREEVIGVTLDHPSILAISRVDSEKSRPYIVMEYLEGQTLAAWLHTQSPLPESDAVRIASQICSGLDYLHRKGVVHRDLKPENIMLCKDGTIRILDFGIAKSEGVRRLTLTGYTASMGTPDYIAPEQVQGKRGDQRSDIYALGAMLYEMTTGAPPYDGDNLYVVMNARLTDDPEAPRIRNPNLSSEIEEIILHALERNPSERFHSAAAMKAELDDYRAISTRKRSKKLHLARLYKVSIPLLCKITILVLAQILILFLFFQWLNHTRHHDDPATIATPRVENKTSLPRSFP